VPNDRCNCDSPDKKRDRERILAWLRDQTYVLNWIAFAATVAYAGLGFPFLLAALAAIGLWFVGLLLISPLIGLVGTLGEATSSESSMFRSVIRTQTRRVRGVAKKLIDIAFQVLRSYRPQLSVTKVFEGLLGETHELEGEQVVFDRFRELERLESILTDDQKRGCILTVTGQSGVGKSFLMRLLRDRLNQSPHVRSVKLAKFDDPSRQTGAIIEELVAFIESDSRKMTPVDERTDQSPVVLILDQFEILLDRIIRGIPGSLDGDPGYLGDFLKPEFSMGDPSMESLAQLLRRPEDHPWLRIVVVARSDRYYDLRMLGSLGQKPHKAFEVRGITKAECKSLTDALHSIGVEPNASSAMLEDLTEEDGTVLPVKAQIAGSMIERYHRRIPDSYWEHILALFRPRSRLVPTPITEEDYRNYGRLDGLIEQFFRLQVRSSDNPSVARELFYVLSIEGRVKSRYGLKNLSEITFRDETTLENVISHFEGNLIRAADARYYFAHDYLAQSYNRLSGRLLRPVVRDNLSYSHAAAMIGLRRSTPQSLPSARKSLVSKIGLITLSLLFWSFFLIRFVRSDWCFDLFVDPFPLGERFKWFIFDFSPYTMSPRGHVDWQYLPIAVVQSLWAYYVIRLVGWVFAPIDKTLRMHIGSWLLVLVVLAGMVCTAFIPGTWLAWIGISGIAVGAKFWTLGRTVRDRTAQKNRLSMIGVYTVLHSVFAVYLGLAFYSGLEWSVPSVPGFNLSLLLHGFLTLDPMHDYFCVFYAIVPLVVYFYYMYKSHVSTDSAIELIGLYRRVEAISQR
jgi:hypothetical protein